MTLQLQGLPHFPLSVAGCHKLILAATCRFWHYLSICNHLICFHWLCRCCASANRHPHCFLFMHQCLSLRFNLSLIRGINRCNGRLFTAHSAFFCFSCYLCVSFVWWTVVHLGKILHTVIRIFWVLDYVMRLFWEANRSCNAGHLEQRWLFFLPMHII